MDANNSRRDANIMGTEGACKQRLKPQQGLHEELNSSRDNRRVYSSTRDNWNMKGRQQKQGARNEAPV
jgi:hypothetical protein